MVNFTSEGIDALPTAAQLEKEIKRSKYKKDYIRVFVGTVSSLVVAAAVAVLISLLLMPVLRVTGSSMNPTLENDELIICSRQGSFKRGDIIAFYYNNKVLLKRVIGVSGDEINITDDGTVYVNGKKIDEPYVSEKSLGECDLTFPYTVPDQRVFVMGDNRAVSVDSRSSVIGSVSEEAVVGKAVFRISPFKKAGRL